MVGPAEVTWVVCKGAQTVAGFLEQSLGEHGYENLKSSLKAFLCDYFTSPDACVAKLGKSISPIRCGVRHAKGLKVRFGYPGCGKSGGLRLAVLAFCEQKQVKIAGAWLRKEDPDAGDLTDAFRQHDQ
ncbi:MAG: hypothetical protein ABIP94_09225 [Planctomycetota bacterium]